MRNGWAIGAGLFLLGFPAVAAADARVQVRITDSTGRGVDGTVALVAGARRLTCTTTASRCVITAPAGTYTTAVTARAGGTPAARTVRVPSSGTVSLTILTPRPATTSTPSTSGTSGTSGSGTSSTTGSGTTGSTAAGRTSSSTSSSASLARGTRVVCQGTVRDAAGRAVDGRVTVRRGSTTLGTVPTTAGRFSLYDLTPGTYTLAVSGASGSGTSTVSITAGTARPTITVR